MDKRKTRTICFAGKLETRHNILAISRDDTTVFKGQKVAEVRRNAVKLHVLVVKGGEEYEAAAA